VRYVYLTRPSIFISDKRILSYERMLRNDYDRKVSVGKTYLVVSLEGLGTEMNSLTVNRNL
jgi:hypothetical protein